MNNIANTGEENELDSSYRTENKKMNVPTSISNIGESHFDARSSIPSIRDVDTITTVESDYKGKDDRGALITPGTMLPSRTMVTQNHLQNIQRNIFVQKSNDENEWYHNFDAGINNNPYPVRVDRYDVLDRHYSTFVPKVRCVEKDNSEVGKEIRERERLLESKLQELQSELSRSKEKHKEKLLRMKETHEQQLQSYKDRFDVQLERYKEKYEEAKENLREAKQMQFATENTAKQMDRLRDMQISSEQRRSCVIQ
jgi:hypothetical protein